jgi:hypothetical protein
MEGKQDFMDEDREKKVSYIKDEIQQGKYRVDPQAVADAILERLRELGVTGDDEPSFPRASSTPPRGC